MIPAWIVEYGALLVRGLQTTIAILLISSVFGFVLAGWALLSATLVAGLLFDEQLYGAALPFQWTHKVVFAWLAWLTFVLLLLGRWRLGWRGRKAVHMVYAGGVFLLLSYIGSRFVLEALLHRAA